MEEEQSQVMSGIVRNPDGTFPQGTSGNPSGMPPMTEEQKLARQAKKEAIEKIKEEYLDGLADALPLIAPQIKGLATTGDIKAIIEVHNRVFGKSKEHKQIDANINGKIDGAREIAALIQSLDDDTEEPTEGTDSSI